MREDEDDDGQESTGKGRRYLWVALLSLVVFSVLFWYFRIWKGQESEIAVLPVEERAPAATPVRSEAVDAMLTLDQTVPVSVTPEATIPPPDVPPPPAPTASPVDPPTFPKTLKGEEIVPLNPQKPTSVKRPKRRAPARGTYTIQVASFADETSATALTKRLKGKGYDAYVTQSDVPGVGVRWRVRVGHFENRVKAQSVAERLQKKEGLAFFLATDGA